MRIALLSAAFPPQLDGIGDYTWWLSKELAEQGQEVTVFTSFAPARPRPSNVEIIGCFDASAPRTVTDGLRPLRQTNRFDWLVVQYNPFSFGRRGFAPWLVSALRTTGIPIGFMFHEIFAVPLWPWKLVVMRLWQYPQFAALVRTGLCHFAPTERWLAHVQRWTNAPSFLLPVGSNLPLCRLTKSEARKHLGLPTDALVVGLFGFANISKRTEWIGAAARLIQDRFPQTLVLTVGQVGNSVQAACEDVAVLNHGSLPGPEVSIRLRAMDLFLAPFSDGISARRGSVIAALQHGLPICSTVGAHTDGFLRNLVSPAFSLTPSDNKTLFAEASVGMAEKFMQQPDLGRDLIAFHDRYFTWPVIAEQMLTGLRKAESRQPSPQRVEHLP